MNEKDNRGTAGPYANLEQNSSDGEPFSAQGSEAQSTRVDIVVRNYRRLEFDPDGISVKAAIDGLVARGILAGDSTKQIASITYKGIKSKEEKTIIEITEA